MMPTPEEMTEVTKLIESRMGSTYQRDGTAVIETIEGDLSWNDLTGLERQTILEFNVTWKGFTPEQKQDVIGNVISGAEPAGWMDGIFFEREAERWADAEPWADMDYSEDWTDLAAEIKADEQAARVRDYGEADAATYEQRVAEGAGSINHLETQPEPIDPIELERALTEIEASWPAVAEPSAAPIHEEIDNDWAFQRGTHDYEPNDVADYERLLRQSAQRTKEEERGPER
jgi:hypothetical protein